MRILHTSDWHAGKLLYRQDRTPDLKFALDQMLTLIEAEAVELVLVPGDLYDSFHPPANASQVLFDFFLELNRRGIPSVVIAGNHDSQKHWGSLRQLLALAHVHVVDKPSLQQAHLTLKLASGVQVGITALPYPHERQLVQLIEDPGDRGQQHMFYAERVAQLLKVLSDPLPAGDIQILVSHLMMNGAQPGKGERELSTSLTYAVYGQALPAVFDYVALGHIHRRQAVFGSTPPAWYCGTPYPVDFGETDTEKGVLLVDFQSGRAPQIEFRSLVPRRELRLLDIHEDQLPETLENLQGFEGWLKLRIRTAGPRRTLADEVRKKLGAVLLTLEIHTPQSQKSHEPQAPLRLENPLEVYRAFYAAQQRTLSPELEHTFCALLEEIRA